MSDLSLRHYLQKKGTGPGQGVRWCVPSLRKISLRALLRGINRRIIHLSDLHIGLNDSAIPATQVQKIIDAIIRTYPKQDESYEYPRPIVVITGDLVDYYSPSYLYTAFSLLQQLTEQGFTVLVIPGNHDYSDSFSTDSFLPALEALPGTGEIIKVVAGLVNAYISKGQNRNLVSGLTYSPVAASKFKEKMAPYLGQNGSYLDSWKDKGAIFDLDFILMDGQDKEANRPDWDDPRRLVREKVHDAVLGFKGIPAGVNKQTLADTIANAVANLTLEPVTIYATTLQTVIVIEETVYITAYTTAFAALSAAALVDPVAAATVASLLIAAHPIIELLDLGLAATVASVAAAAVTGSLVDDKFFLHDGSFRLAHGYLDAEGLQSFKDRVAEDVASKTLPIACIHYWLNYPYMDAQYNHNDEDATHNIVNESDLFETLDKCHMLLVGHIHENQYGSMQTFQKSTKRNTLAYYSRVGSTIPSPVEWNDEYELKAHQRWLELTINLNSGEVSPRLIDVDGNSIALKFDRDRLQSGQQLNVNDQLESNNGYFNLIMQRDGNLVLYRTQFRWPLWASNTTGSPVDHVMMQGDGNLLAFSPQGASHWNTETSGYPDAQLVLQDDGDLVVYDRANNRLWASNTKQDISLITPTFEYSDANGYKYDETSESWQQMCRAFPCFNAVQFPGYATKVIDMIDGQPLVIDGQRVVIQLWKGWCGERVANFPGGIGAEVGVYRRIPGRVRSTLDRYISTLPPDLVGFILNNIGSFDNELWWPFPELNAKLEFTLVNPITGQAFFSAGPVNSYWLCKWMTNDSYSKYRQDQGYANTPENPKDFWFDYKINGNPYQRWR